MHNHAPNWAYPSLERGDFTETSPRNWLLTKFRELTAAALSAAAAMAQTGEADPTALLAFKDKTIAELSERIDDMQRDLLAATESKADNQAILQLTEKAAAEIAAIRQAAQHSEEALRQQLATAQKEVTRLTTALNAAQMPETTKSEILKLAKERDAIRDTLQAVSQAKTELESELAKTRKDLIAARQDALNASEQAAHDIAKARAERADAQIKSQEALVAQRADLEAACRTQLNALQAQLAAKAPIDNSGFGVVELVDDSELAKVLEPKATTPTVVIGDATDVKPLASATHHCFATSPAHLDPLFNAMKDAKNALGTAPVLDHFINCRTGILGHMQRESGLRYKAVTKEAPAKGSSTPRYSYGLIQILDDTGAGLYALRARLGPFAQKIKQLNRAAANGEPDPLNMSELTTPASGVWYVVLFMLGFDKWLHAYFDAPNFYATGILRPKQGIQPESTERATRIATFVNSISAANPDVDAVATLFRLYGLASSLVGVDRVIESGRAQASLVKYIEHAKDFTAKATAAA